MYRKIFEAAFSDVAPSGSDAEFADKIISAGSGEADKKRRAFPKKAAAIPIAIAAAAAVTVTASASGGFGLFYKIARSFSGDSSAGLEAAGVSQSTVTFELDDYTVSINGFVADSTYIYAFYDVTYKDVRYFDENGEVAQKFLEYAPVWLNKKVGAYTWGWGRAVSHVGSTVSYVQDFSGENEICFDEETGMYKFDFFCCCFSDTRQLSDYFIDQFSFSDSVPPAKERTVSVNAEIFFPDGKTAVLQKAHLGPLSARFRLEGVGNIAKNFDDSDIGFGLRMKDGSFVSLGDKSWAFRPDDTMTDKPPYDDPFIEETVTSASEKEPQESGASTLQPVKAHDDFSAAETYGVSVEPSESACSEQGSVGTAAVCETMPAESSVEAVDVREGSDNGELQIGYGTMIDPDDIVSIELYGHTYHLG